MNWYKQAQVNTNYVFLYRGMSIEDFDRYQKTGVLQKTPHNGNSASTNIETARYYASQHDDPGVIISFEAPIHEVKQDAISKEDYSFISDIHPKNVKIVENSISLGKWKEDNHELV